MALLMIMVVTVESSPYYQHDDDYDSSPETTTTTPHMPPGNFEDLNYLPHFLVRVPVLPRSWIFGPLKFTEIDYNVENSYNPDTGKISFSYHRKVMFSVCLSVDKGWYSLILSCSCPILFGGRESGSLSCLGYPKTGPGQD